MPEYMIAGVPVNFPFEPYDVQKAYMEKVITCLRDGTNGVLESPTGTGKTLSLLCSTLAWVLQRKNEIKSMIQKNSKMPAKSGINEDLVNKAANFNVIPKIIYASRTHSQLTQCMQELKKTSYNFMRAVVLGSRDQLCIHPDVSREVGNATKTQMCQLKIHSKTCSFHLRIESKKDHPDFRQPSILDIEDLVKVGQKLRMCTYFASKELIPEADIIFMPYNYILDPMARKANKIELSNTVIILDEAHNIEKMCEEAASVMIRSSDIALAIDDTTHIMKAMSSAESMDFGDEPKDFSLEDLALLKEMLLSLEKAIDEITVQNANEGSTFPANFIFELLAKANFNYSTAAQAVALLDKLLQYLAVESQNSGLRKGGSFQVLSSFLSVVFVNKESLMDKIVRSFKVHVQIEEVKQEKKTHNTGWLSKGTTTSTKAGKIINYWCFNPGFGMEQLLNQNVRSVILTSGTLAPLKPLIAELAIPISQALENPHIVSPDQVYVKIIGSGPDREQLISNYANRDNPKYISSLGQTVLNISRVVPDGLLVFFPSYPLLNQCVNSWQASGLWSNLSNSKPIFVEPRSKDSFTSTMEEFYQSIRDSKGACFLAVCRGKVSEGLDFADRNGRAVIITGLPFPPLKDPKVILKRKYLDENRTKENELLSGQAWYGLDATRAVNQAIGRVIRHRNDYGAILLCDIRFQQSTQVQQLSKWIRPYLGSSPKCSAFGPINRELREFFKKAEKTIPQAKERKVDNIMEESMEAKELVRSPYFNESQPTTKWKPKTYSYDVEKTNVVENWTPADYIKAAGKPSGSRVPAASDLLSRLDEAHNASMNSTSTDYMSEVKIHKRVCLSPPVVDLTANDAGGGVKKKRFKLVTISPLSATSSSQATSSNSPPTTTNSPKEAPEDRVEFLRVLRGALTATDFNDFRAALIAYKGESKFDKLMEFLLRVLGTPELRYMLIGMRRFLKLEHKAKFDEMMA